MRSIDVEDLPEPLARAIESMVQALRGEVARGKPPESHSNGVDDFDRALTELFAADSRQLPSPSLTYRREDIYLDHD